MKQERILVRNYRRGGACGTRFLSALLAIGIVLSMSVGAYAAAEMRHGRGAGYMLHRADGTPYTSRELTDREREQYLDWEAKIYDTQRSAYTRSNEMHVLRIGVGETVVLHAAQETIQFRDKGVRSLYRHSMGKEPSVGFDTVSGSLNELDSFTKSNLFHKRDGGQDYYCLEWHVTGLTAGIDYIWYFDNPFDPQYLKIIVEEK